MLGLIRNLLSLLEAYVRHLTATDLDRRIDLSRRELREMAAEIHRLRAIGGESSTQRADWLRKEYGGESRHLGHLRAQRAAATSRADGAHK